MESILKFGQCGAIALLCFLQCPWTVSQFQSLHFANNDQNIKHVRNLAKASELCYQYTDGTYLQSGETPPDNIEADAYVQLPKDD